MGRKKGQGKLRMEEQRGQHLGTPWNPDGWPNPHIKPLLHPEVPRPDSHILQRYSAKVYSTFVHVGTHRGIHIHRIHANTHVCTQTPVHRHIHMHEHRTTHAYGTQIHMCIICTQARTTHLQMYFCVHKMHTYIHPYVKSVAIEVSGPEASRTSTSNLFSSREQET